MTIDLNQVKKDRDAGMIISRATWDAVLELAIEYASRSIGDWISVNDERKPEARKPILLYVRTIMRGDDNEGIPFEINGAEVAMGEYLKGESAQMSYFDCYTSPMSDSDWITHWMPLPQAPEVKEC